MNELRILGDLDLRGTDGNRVDSIVAQPKRLALLAYLTLATPGGTQQRDLLISVFWPELDESNARNSLNQSLHRLRLALGPETVASRGTNEVGIDPTKLSCDALDFVEAVKDGELERALELYRGDLLKGLFVSGSPEFERWLDGERARYGRQAFDAAMTVGRRAENGGDPASAARWYRRAMTIMPERGTAVRRLMAILAQAGNPAEAVQVFEAFSARLAEDYGLKPSEETRAVADSIHGSLAAEEVVPPERGATGRQAQAQEFTDAWSSPATSQRTAHVHPWHRRLAMAAVSAVVLVLAAMSIRWLASTDETMGTEALRVAVLPFENLSGDPDDDYFADGLHSELLTRLHAARTLKVISRQSMLEYRGTKKDLKTIADELGVQTVMEASVQRSGSRVRVNAQLIDARTDEHLWAEVYDRELTAESLFDVQGSIALEVARALGVDLPPDVEPASATWPTQNLQAYEFYLRGRSLYGQFFSGSGWAAMEMFGRATELDSTFAPAHAWLAFTSAVNYWFQMYPSEELATQARQAAARALELAPGLPETHMAVGTVRYYLERDYAKALKEYGIALRSWPNSAELYLYIGSVKRRQGDFLGARDDFARAVRLDRNFTIAALELANEERFLRDYRTAERHYLDLIASRPNLKSAYQELALMYVTWTGRTDRSRTTLEEIPGGWPSEGRWLELPVALDRLDRDYQAALESYALMPDTLYWRSYFLPKSMLIADVLQRLGRVEEARLAYDSARVVLDGWLAEHPDDPRAHSSMGIVLAGLGRRAAALTAARTAVDLMPLEKDALQGAVYLQYLAQVQAMVGESEAAIDGLERILSLPGPLSVALLRTDPTWDPLRDQPRFQALVARADD